MPVSPPSPANRPPIDVRSVLFDFDGTLVDLDIDWPLIRKRVTKLAGEYGIVSDPWGVIQGVLKARDILRHHPDAQLDAVRFAKRAYGIIAEEEWMGLYNARAISGAAELLQTCLDWNKRIAIVSNSSRRVVTLALEQFGFPKIGAIVGREDVHQVMPDAEPVLQGLDSIGGSASHTLFVGDAPEDVLAARAAGVFPVMIGSMPIWANVFESRYAHLAELEGVIEYL